jgi:predicted phage terminase large subunit-like protein
MQRVHVDDLTGFVLGGPNDWTVLKLPAIGLGQERVEIGHGRVHERHPGDVLWPVREPLAILETYRLQLGSDIFSAQYQQEPMPPEGAMIKRPWVQRYTTLPPRTGSSRVIQSWDTASKGGAENDYSACSIWLMHEMRYYLMHVHRGRHDYPELKKRALALAEQYRPTKILIEDAGTGSALIQELRRLGRPAIGIKPTTDKVARMSAQSAKFEAGLVYFPERAPWLPELEAELFAFPGSRHDDQVDSISQALAHANVGTWVTCM